jgi:hypothetical protein
MPLVVLFTIPNARELLIPTDELSGFVLLPNWSLKPVKTWPGFPPPELVTATIGSFWVAGSKSLVVVCARLAKGLKASTEAPSNVRNKAGLGKEKE